MYSESMWIVDLIFFGYFTLNNNSLTNNTKGTAILFDSIKQVCLFSGLIRLISQPMELINKLPGNKSNKRLQDSFRLGEHLNTGGGYSSPLDFRSHLNWKIGIWFFLLQDLNKFRTSSSLEHGQLTSIVFSKSALEAAILSSFSGITKNEFRSIVLYDKVNGLRSFKFV